MTDYDNLKFLAPPSEPVDEAPVAAKSEAPAHVPVYSDKMLADLARSGLDAKDALRLCLEDVASIDMRSVLGFKTFVESEDGKEKKTKSQLRHGYKMPYFDLDGNPQEFVRVRFLDGCMPKYQQPKGTRPSLYIPPYKLATKSKEPITWREVATNKNIPIYITEGEKKAVTMCRVLRLPCIGIGGVWSFKSKKNGEITLLTEFGEFDLKGRTIIIIFDSDIIAKPQVLRALYGFAHSLSVSKAYPNTLSLPEGPNATKTGLDDYILRECNSGDLDKDRAKWETFEATKAEFTAYEALWELNKTFAVLKVPSGGIMREKPFDITDYGRFTKVIAAPYKVPWPGKDGRVDVVPAAAKWLEWAARREYEGLVYVPGDPSDYVLRSGVFHNLWHGWGAGEPVEGDVTPWDKALRHLFIEAPEYRKWFEQWVAYPIQHPGYKMMSAVLIWGRMQGSGKSLVGLMIGEVYGNAVYNGVANFYHIKKGSLVGQFNEWSKHRQFVLAEEICTGDKRDTMDEIKDYITSDTVEVNAKHQRQYVLKNTINFFFCSNNPAALYLEPDDRRFFVHRHEVYLEATIGKPWLLWAQTSEGKAALFWHLLHVDLTGFNPDAPPPITPAKLAMQQKGMSQMDRWADELRHNPAPFMECDFWTLEQIAEKAFNGRGGNIKALETSLELVGFQKTNRLATRIGNFEFYTINNAETWLAKSDDEKVAYLNKTCKLKF